MNPHLPLKTQDGTILQSGIQTRRVAEMPDSARGLNVRGVVVATYIVDDINHPHAGKGDGPKAVYCDVVTYSGIPGFRFRMLPQCLVKQDRGGIHSGKIWKPRAAKISVNGEPLDPKYTNLANMDGDHVLIGFIDDSFSLPIILGAIAHPNVDLGNEQADVGHRLNLKILDGDPDFWKHHGAFYGVSDGGDFVVDTTKAYAGADLLPTGNEPPAIGDGSTGNFPIKLPLGAKLTVQIAGGDTFELDLKDALAKLKVGNGAVHAVIQEALQDFWDNTVKPKFDAADAHTHVGGMGPTSIPSVLVALPVLAPATKSSKVSFPDG